MKCLVIVSVTESRLVQAVTLDLRTWSCQIRLVTKKTSSRRCCSVV